MEIDFSKVGKLKPFAHHPDCTFYNNHLIKMFSLSFCLGCFSLSIGLVIAIISFFISTKFYHYNYYFLIFSITLLIPTFIQPFYQKKAFKIFSRMCLGLGIGYYWLPIIFYIPNTVDDLIIKSLLLLLFIFITKKTLTFRNNYTPNPCDNCIYGVKPMCQHYIHEYELLLEEAIIKNNFEVIQLLSGIIKSIKEGKVGIKT